MRGDRAQCAIVAATFLNRAFCGHGGVGAAGWCFPDQDSGFWLFEVPALGLFAPMVMPAERIVPVLAYMAVELVEL